MSSNFFSRSSIFKIIVMRWNQLVLLDKCVQFLFFFSWTKKYLHNFKSTQEALVLLFVSPTCFWPASTWTDLIHSQHWTFSGRIEANTSCRGPHLAPASVLDSWFRYDDASLSCCMSLMVSYSSEEVFCSWDPTSAAAWSRTIHPSEVWRVGLGILWFSICFMWVLMFHPSVQPVFCDDGQEVKETRGALRRCLCLWLLYRTCLPLWNVCLLFRVCRVC